MKILATLLLIFLLNSPTPSSAQEKAFQENESPIAEQNKDIGYFDKIVMAGGGNLTITQSPVTTLKIVDQRSCLQSLKTMVKSDTLMIYRTSDSSNCRPNIYVGMPVLKEIRQDGGGAIQISEGFDTMASFHCIINGGGSVNMEMLKVDSFYATINGGGRLSMYANKLLEADIKNGGFISYQGNPEVLSNISGGGSVKRK